MELQVLDSLTHVNSRRLFTHIIARLDSCHMDDEATVISDVMSCRLVNNYRRFEGTW